MIYEQILKMDRHYHKIKGDEASHIINNAIKTAESLAKEYPQQFINKTIESEKFDIVITTNPAESLVKYRARIEISNNTKIYIYEDSIKEMCKKFPEINEKQAEAMFVAHEFLHFLEYQKAVDNNYYISTKLLGFNRKVNISSYSEIVANEYARLVTGSSINPMQIDMK